MGNDVGTQLPPHLNGRSAWIEVTKEAHEHGGSGWEFGTCLWSPTSNRSGARRYEIMRELGPGDLVIHWLEQRDGSNVMTGWSQVATRTRVLGTPPPNPGPWADFEAYYRIELRGYSTFATPLSVVKFLRDHGDEISADRREAVNHYPVSTYGEGLRTQQGLYLGRCTPLLYTLIRDSVGLEAQVAENGIKGKEGEGYREEFLEARRSARERSYFARNPGLVKEAKAHYGSTCQACGFDFASVYGDLAAGYIECHHLQPLAERHGQENVRSTVKDVAVLCAKCHRAIHRRRPALALDELKQSIGRMLGV